MLPPKKFEIVCAICSVLMYYSQGWQKSWLFDLNQIYRLTFCNGKSQSTILTGFLIKACLLINIRDKNAKKIMGTLKNSHIDFFDFLKSNPK